MQYDEIVQFHGHRCPGLAIGYRMAAAALDALSSLPSADEELLAIVENDACGVDALQCLTGCTFGKGNLIFRDYGKQVYTVYSRHSGRGVRVLFHGRGTPDEVRGDRQKREQWILTAPRDEILSVAEVTITEPERARIRKSVLCDGCGEPVMESRIRQQGAKKLCIPCAGETA